MAIDNLGIYPNQQGTPIGSSLRIYAADGTVAPYIRFKTQSAVWTAADIAVSVDVITKSGTEGLNGYVPNGSVIKTSIARGSFISVSGSDADGYIWGYALSSITGLASLIGTLSYSGRSYDNIALTVRVTCYYLGGSTTGQTTVWIGFIPVYTASEIYIDKNGLTVAYTASGWSRPNDRWAVQDITDGTKTVVNDSDVYGKAGSAGKLTIPKEKLLYIPKNGDTLTGYVRMTGSWMGNGTQLGLLDLSTVTVTDKYVTKKPTLSLALAPDGVTATVGQTGTGSDLDAVEVSLVGSDYAMDRHIITLSGSPLSGSYTFPAVPYNTAMDFQAVGYSSAAGELAASPVVAASVTALASSSVAITHEGGSSYLHHNISVQTSTKPEVKTVKLAGRKRQTVGFGDGGSQTWRVSGTIVTSHASLPTTTENDIIGLPEVGVCIFRFPDGKRAQVYITDASCTRRVHGGVLMGASVDAEEVS